MSGLLALSAGGLTHVTSFISTDAVGRLILFLSSHGFSSSASLKQLKCWHAVLLTTHEVTTVRRVLPANRAQCVEYVQERAWRRPRDDHLISRVVDCVRGTVREEFARGRPDRIRSLVVGCTAGPPRGGGASGGDGEGGRYEYPTKATVKFYRTEEEGNEKEEKKGSGMKGNELVEASDNGQTLTLIFANATAGARRRAALRRGGGGGEEQSGDGKAGSEGEDEGESDEDEDEDEAWTVKRIDEYKTDDGEGRRGASSLRERCRIALRCLPVELMRPCQDNSRGYSGGVKSDGGGSRSRSVGSACSERQGGGKLSAKLTHRTSTTTTTTTNTSETEDQCLALSSVIRVVDRGPVKRSKRWGRLNVLRRGGAAKGGAQVGGREAGGDEQRDLRTGGVGSGGAGEGAGGDGRYCVYKHEPGVGVIRVFTTMFTDDGEMSRGLRRGAHHAAKHHDDTGKLGAGRRRRKDNRGARRGRNPLGGGRGSSDNRVRARDVNGASVGASASAVGVGGSDVDGDYMCDDAKPPAAVTAVDSSWLEGCRPERIITKNHPKYGLPSVVLSRFEGRYCG